MQDDDKRSAAEAAVNEVADGMLVGLGTGSTAAHFIRALAARRLAVTTVATSDASAALARSLGLPVRDFAEVARVDLTVDGVDEVDATCRAIKGAGGAMVREKIVASASTRMIAIADGSKRVEQLGKAALPVEVLPFARAFVEDRLKALGLVPVLRRAGDGEAYLTDQRNLVLDCSGVLGKPLEPLAAALDAIPGVVGHGLFLAEIDLALIASSGQVSRLERNTG